ncbi:MAG: hypothetical protein D6702_04950 [Planctomycetota bacterium]|nr:MAG: hypothetical protein D6702_04950 [Planctomycetota bacterium]
MLRASFLLLFAGLVLPAACVRVSSGAGGDRVEVSGPGLHVVVDDTDSGSEVRVEAPGVSIRVDDSAPELDIPLPDRAEADAAGDGWFVRAPFAEVRDFYDERLPAGGGWMHRKYTSPTRQEAEYTRTAGGRRWRLLVAASGEGVRIQLRTEDLSEG